MNAKILFVILLIIGGAVIFGLTTRSKQKSFSEDIPTKTTKTAQLFTPQNKTMGEVEVEVTPVLITPDENTVFQLSFNTHSVDLSYDYTQIVTLNDNFGNTYKALNWTGENSGHHLQGELMFEPLTKSIQTITLNIDGVDNQQASFQWDL